MTNERITGADERPTGLAAERKEMTNDSISGAHKRPASLAEEWEEMINDSSSGADKLAGLVNTLTIPILWLTIFDACLTVYVHAARGGRLRAITYTQLFDSRFDVVFVLALLSILLTAIISVWCGSVMRPARQQGSNERDSDNEHAQDQLYLHRALSAGITGITLIILEPLLSWGLEAENFSFNFEELLLGSSGLNMLMEETKLARQYRDLRLRRSQAQKESESLIDQIRNFKAEIVGAFERTFGVKARTATDVSSEAPGPKPGAEAPGPKTRSRSPWTETRSRSPWTETRSRSPWTETRSRSPWTETRSPERPSLRVVPRVRGFLASAPTAPSGRVHERRQTGVAVTDTTPSLLAH